MSETPLAPPPSEPDDRGTREPFYGSCFGAISLAAVVGGPIWGLLTALIHASAVASIFRELRQSAAEIEVDELSVWEVAASVPLLLSSTSQAAVLTLLILVVIGATVVVVRGVAVRLDGRLSARASSRYAAESDDAAILTAESWSRDLPEPDPEPEPEPEPAEEPEADRAGDASEPPEPERADT